MTTTTTTKKTTKKNSKTKRTPLGAFSRLRAELKATYAERDDVVEVSMLAMLTGEHAALIGPPGTGKSAIANDIARAIDARLFRYLLTKFTGQDEIFGMFDLPKLQQGAFERNTTNRLPEADIAFLDEAFKANSAVLNALLTMLNEREYEQGGVFVRAPLRTVFAASNELPGGTMQGGDEELSALWDRFLFRVLVEPVRFGDAFDSILMQAVTPPAGVTPNQLTLDDWSAAMDEVRVVKFDRELATQFRTTLAKLQKTEGVTVSMRRAKRCVRVLQAAAWIDGRDAVEEEDFLALRHCLWNTPEEASKVRSALGSSVAPVVVEAQAKFDACLDSVRAILEDPNSTMETKGRALQQVDIAGNAIKAMRDKASGRTARKLDVLLTELSRKRSSVLDSMKTF